jgi:hypothetical protein
MPSGDLAIPAFLVAAGAAGLATPKYALLAYRASRGLSLDPDAESTAKVRVVSALFLLIGVLGLARRLA